MTHGPTMSLPRVLVGNLCSKELDDPPASLLTCTAQHGRERGAELCTRSAIARPNVIVENAKIQGGIHIL